MNNENIQGRNLADGALIVLRSGRELEGVYPVWDWARIPGTTELMTGQPLTCSNVQAVDHTSFVGGVSDGLYGWSSMDFLRKETAGPFVTPCWKCG